MAKIELVVADPQTLNSGANAQPVQMTYGDTDSPIVIDTETAFIECEAQNKSASINKWLVDFNGHKMKLADDTIDGSYDAINYVTAVGMVCQLGNEVGLATLQALLVTLQETFKTGESPVPSSGNDAPTENSPDLPKESELPGPVNPDEI